MSAATETIDATAAAVGSKVTAGGSAVTVVGWMTASDWGIWAGIFIGISGLLINWYFKSRDDRRQQQAHDAFMESLELPVAQRPKFNPYQKKQYEADE